MPDTSQPPSPPEQNLAESFWMVARRLRHLSRDAVAPWDITPSHARALAVLAHHGELRSGELADHLHVVARSVTDLVDDLVDRGLVERRSDLHDRRAVLVRLTDEGTRVAEAIAQARAVQAETFFAVLSATDRAHLTRILGRLRD